MQISWLAASNEDQVFLFIQCVSNLAATFLATLRIAFSYMHTAHPTLPIAKASVTHCTFAGVAIASFALSGCMLFLVLCRCVLVSVCAICFTIVLLSEMAGKHVVLFSCTCFYTDLSVLQCILLAHCSFTLPTLYICVGYVLL